MSDYKFLHNPTSNVSFNVTFSGTTFEITGATTFAVGDAVYLPVSDTTGVFGLCTSGGTTATFGYDNELYGSFSGSQTVTGSRFWQLGSDLLYDDVTSYRTIVQVERGLYSETYRTYSSSVDYQLVIDNKRREFDRDTQYKSTKQLILANDVVFTDACKEVAYGVGFAGSDFDVFNNKFKSSLEFNIATR